MLHFDSLINKSDENAYIYICECNAMQQRTFISKPILRSSCFDVSNSCISYLQPYSLRHFCFGRIFRVCLITLVYCIIFSHYNTFIFS